MVVVVAAGLAGLAHLLPGGEGAVAVVARARPAAVAAVRADLGARVALAAGHVLHE